MYSKDIQVVRTPNMLGLVSVCAKVCCSVFRACETSHIRSVRVNSRFTSLLYQVSARVCTLSTQKRNNTIWVIDFFFIEFDWVPSNALFTPLVEIAAPAPI